MTAPPAMEDPQQFRDAVLQKIGELSAENERLLHALSRSEERFRGIVEAVWRVQENERRGMARDLHDGVGQMLTALTNQLQRIDDDARAMGNLGLSQRLTDALEMTRGALRDTRELSRLLRPSMLDDLGLEPALSWLARTLGERTGMNIELHSNLGDRRLHPDIETLVFRISQEALTNAIRHSGASEAHIVLTLADTLLRLRVRDHGHGFDVGLGERHDSVGLRGMRDRAELFGGRLEISSAAGEGTTVQLKLPLDGYGEPSPATHPH